MYWIESRQKKFMQSGLGDAEENIQLFELKNNKGMSVGITNFGATITSMNVPDKLGHIEDVALGYKDPRDYKRRSHPNFGCAVGRVGNRIANARFTLNNETYNLTRNDGENHLHGGTRGFDKVLWTIESRSDNSITLGHLSQDGDQGYPGNLKVSVTYSLNDENEIHINYRATSDKPTPVSLTNHTYFNLRGEGNGKIDDHVIIINASEYSPVDSARLPTGIERVDDTPYDLRKPIRIGDGLARTPGDQYDNHFILDAPFDGKRLHNAAHVEDPLTGRVLDVRTTEPGMQFYTANYFGDNDGKKTGKKSRYEDHGAFCLETQHIPDSVNHQGDPKYPSVILNPGVTYESETVYKFSIQKSQPVHAR
jgi:aldose 1-epimerase